MRFLIFVVILLITATAIKIRSDSNRPRGNNVRLDFSRLWQTTPGCVITDPDGKVIEPDDTGGFYLPEGSRITGECFISPKGKPHAD